MWEKALPLVVGAIGTLCATVFVQLVVVPRAESRKRRADRWERDVRALGELLSFGMADAWVEMSRTLWLEVSISCRRDDLPEKDLHDLRDAQSSRMTRAFEDMQRAVSQTIWLMDQVSTPDLRLPNEVDAVTAMTKFLVASGDLRRAYVRTHPQLFPEDARRLTEDMQGALIDLEDVVRFLSWRSFPRPHGPVHRRVKALGRMLTSPVRHARLVAQRKEEDELMSWAESEFEVADSSTSL